MKKENLNHILRQALIKESRCKVTANIIEYIRAEVERKNTYLVKLSEQSEMSDEWENLNKPLIEKTNIEIEELFGIIDILVDEIN